MHRPAHDRRPPRGAVRFAALAALLASAAQAAPQTSPQMPLRPGLWEQHHAQSLNGAEIEVPAFLIDQARQAGVDISNDGRSERLCLSAENLAEIGQPSDAALPDCRKENVRLTDKGLSLKLVCADAGGSGEGTVNAIFDSSTYYHGTFDFTGTHALFGGNLLPLTVSGRFTGRWLSPQCPVPAAGAG